jgi:NTP pyrophosphatase (non-canonical NTP hydrolase)
MKGVMTMTTKITSDNFIAKAVRTEAVDFDTILDRLSETSTLRLLHAVMGLGTEIGEFQATIKEHVIYGRRLDLLNVKEELGDILWYVGLAVDAINSTMNEVMSLNIRKLEMRYPEQFTEDNALTRDQPPDYLSKLAKDLGGEIEEVCILPDRSGFAIMSMPLPKDHWIYQGDEYGSAGEPPMPMRMGIDAPLRKAFAEVLIVAGKYAIKAATRCGRDMDFDPDALLQNLIVGALGYHTHDGLSHLEELNKKEEGDMYVQD